VQRVAKTEHKVMGLFFVDTDDVTDRPEDIRWWAAPCAC
jgi:hypothetical protein